MPEPLPPDVIRSLPSVAASLCGTCLAGTALIRLDESRRGPQLWADNVLAVSALAFLITTVGIHLWHRWRHKWMLIIAEWAFMAGCLVLCVVLSLFVLDLAPRLL